MFRTHEPVDKAEKARQLNAARSLLDRHTELSEAAQSLSHKYGMSRRQAYRYLEEAAQLPHPVEVVEADGSNHAQAPSSDSTGATLICETKRPDEPSVPTSLRHFAP